MGAYWPAVIICAICLRGPLLGPIGWVIIALLSGTFRNNLGIDSNCIHDCCCFAFCQLCMVGQQAMTIDRRSGVSVACCFQLSKVTQEGTLVVGEPVGNCQTE